MTVYFGDCRDSMRQMNRDCEPLQLARTAQRGLLI